MDGERYRMLRVRHCMHRGHSIVVIKCFYRTLPCCTYVPRPEDTSQSVVPVANGKLLVGGGR